MFFPVGLGSWPRVIPWAVILVVGICLSWSTYFFQTLKYFEQKAQAQTQALQPLRGKVIIESCLAALELETCSLIEKSIQKKPRKNETSPFSSSPSTAKDVSEIIKGMFQTLVAADQAVTYINKFNEDPAKWPPEAKEAKSYSEYLKLKEKSESHILVLQQKAGIMSRKNFNVDTIIRATFTHSGWFHLISNLIFLVVFGLAVEQRIGKSQTLALFLLGSAAGMCAHVLGDSSAALGASAGISAVMGAFYVFFRKADMKFVFTFGPLYFRSLYFSVLWTLPIFYFIQDVIFSAHDDSHVAHLAHLGGLCFGVLFAFNDQRKDPLPSPFLYHQEKKIFQQMQDQIGSQDPVPAMWPYFEQGMLWNLQNPLFLESFTDVASRMQTNLQQEQFQKIIPWYRFYFRRLIHHEGLEASSIFLEKVRQLIVLRPLLQLLSWQNLLKIADHSTRQSRFQLALILYDFALPQVPQSATRRRIRETYEAIEEKLHVPAE